MRYYTDYEALKVAENFFKYYYHDRGKIKWGGFILSEHRKAIRDFHQIQANEGPQG
ncbi:hypothetical protein [uncultured Limosilactobacillus sp.]|uniref:hypothetical protein n=1 Tax=uncultured Limosilactobacillus sp. TaxID=2837629 RepID=UPI0025E9BA99|nr:hypothetical protein [uncultured Limosilactobacillus sp.]